MANEILSMVALVHLTTEFPSIAKKLKNRLETKLGTEFTLQHSTVVANWAHIVNKLSPVPAPDSSSDSSSDSSIDSSSDSSESEVEMKKPIQAPPVVVASNDSESSDNSSSSDSESDSDSDSDSESEAEIIAPVINKRKAEALATDSQLNSKKAKVVAAPAPAPAAGAGGESDVSDTDVSDTDVSDDSDSDSSDSDSSDSDSDSSDSDSDSDSDSSDSDSSIEGPAERAKKLHEKQLEAKKKSDAAKAAAAAWTPSPPRSPVPVEIVTTRGSDGAAAIGQNGKPFSRVDSEHWNDQITEEKNRDNSYAGTFGDQGFGNAASVKLITTRGKDFRHEKTKRKRSYNGFAKNGGAIDEVVRSTKYKYDSD